MTNSSIFKRLPEVPPTTILKRTFPLSFTAIVCSSSEESLAYAADIRPGCAAVHRLLLLPRRAAVRAELPCYTLTLWTPPVMSKLMAMEPAARSLADFRPSFRSVARSPINALSKDQVPLSSATLPYAYAPLTHFQMFRAALPPPAARLETDRN